MENVLEDKKFRDQLSGTVVQSINQNRLMDEILKLNNQDESFIKSLQEIEKVKSFVGSPETILGSDLTKHGEIAEVVEVGVRRAQQALTGSEMTATFEGVGRLAPEDYRIDGIMVQSKFINGTNNNLKYVLEHMGKYSDFGRDGSYYHIPKDTFKVIEKIMNGENIENLSPKTIEAIKKNVQKIEIESGKEFGEVVKPGVSTYPEVQKGQIHETIKNHEEILADSNESIKESIRKDHQPNLCEAFKATGIAAAVGGTVSLTTSLYQKLKEGKCFYKGDLSAEDWKEVGIDTLKGSAVGGVSGAAIYGLTNYAHLSAPFAGAVVSGMKSVGALLTDLKDGKIDNDEFYELGMIVCSESAIVGFATVAGQAIVPIPVLGAVIGSLAGTLLANALGADNKITTKMIREDLEAYLKQLDQKYKALIDEITNEFNKLGDITKAAFDLENNQRLLSISIELAIAYGVDKSELLTTTEEIDAFMFS